MKNLICLIFLKTILFIIGLTVPIGGFTQEDFETLYNQLKAKVESENLQPKWPESAELDAYLKWMQIKATDRDRAKELARLAEQKGNPYFQNKFTDLANLAQWSGENTIRAAINKFMEPEDHRTNKPVGWEEACTRAGPDIGERLFLGAILNGLSAEDILEAARCLLRYATNDLEASYLYINNESFLGHTDSEGYQVLPKGDWNAYCMPRDEYTTNNQGDPLPGAEIAMETVHKVRVICDFYHLRPEFDDATNLMVQYLKEKKVLCLMPPNEGHKWYIDLAKMYELDKAEEHMEGFYASIQGKVEKEENGIRKPVPNAEIEFEAPKDMQTWTTKADSEGHYKIEGVLLHKNCGPFILRANGDGCFIQEEIPGPIEEPDKSYVLEKNLLFECGVTGYAGRISITKSWNYTKHYDDCTLTYIGAQTITFQGIFKPLKEMEGMEGQPLKMFGVSSVTGTWRHNGDRYCNGGKGCGKCKDLVYQEYGSGSVSPESMKGLIIITNSWPTDIKEVAAQLAQFGMVNWYDIATPTENVPIQNRTKYETDYGCDWRNSTNTATLTGGDLRYKLQDMNRLKGSVSWKSSEGTSGISVTNMTEAIYDQKPFDPEQDGSDYTYTIIWDLKAI